MESAQVREQKKQILAERGDGNVVFACTKWVQLMAFRKPSEDEYLDYIGSVGAPLESTGVAQEQFAMDCLVYPTEPEAKAKVRRLLKAMPNLASDLAHSIEAMSSGDYDPLALDDAQKAELDAKWEFGWGGLTPSGYKPIIMATDEQSGTLVRVASDARLNGDKDNGRKIRSAVLSLVRNLPQEEVEGILGARPGLLMPLWYRAQELVGSGVAELGKG
ncbi:MAG: hypothetical protein ACM3ZE_22895 [Myxococcales bacterium]